MKKKNLLLKRGMLALFMVGSLAYFGKAFARAESSSSYDDTYPEANGCEYTDNYSTSCHYSSGGTGYSIKRCQSGSSSTCYYDTDTVLN